MFQMIEEYFEVTPDTEKIIITKTEKHPPVNSRRSLEQWLKTRKEFLKQCKAEGRQFRIANA